jgi:hypothetical protein
MLTDQQPDRESIEVVGYYGAENVPPKKFDVQLSKRDLFDLISRIL